MVFLQDLHCSLHFLLPLMVQLLLNFTNSSISFLLRTLSFPATSELLCWSKLGLLRSLGKSRL